MVSNWNKTRPIHNMWVSKLLARRKGCACHHFLTINNHRFPTINSQFPKIKTHLTQQRTKKR